MAEIKDHLLDLKLASFRGVPFLVDNISDSGGQKTVVHEFVNSDERFVETLGVLNDAFTISAFVSGDNYKKNRDELIRAMKLKDKGTLVHPFEDDADVFPIGYTVTHTDTVLGIASFSLIFQRTTERQGTGLGVPFKSAFSTSEIISLKETAKDSIAEGFEEQKFGELTAAVQSTFTAARDVLESVTDNFQSVITVTSGITDRVSEAQGLVTNFAEDINSLISQPAVLGTRMMGLYLSVTALAVTPEASFTSLKKLFNFGEDIQQANPDNSISRVKQNDQLIIQSATKAGVLVEAYAAASEIEFGTVEEIDEVIATLSVQFDATVGSVEIGEATIDTTIVLTLDSQRAIADVRDAVRSFLEEQRINTAKIAIVNTKLTSLSVLAYKFYGDLDSLQELIELNKPGDVSNVEGDVEIITV